MRKLTNNNILLHGKMKKKTPFDVRIPILNLNLRVPASKDITVGDYLKLVKTRIQARGVSEQSIASLQKLFVKNDEANVELFEADILDHVVKENETIWIAPIDEKKKKEGAESERKMQKTSKKKKQGQGSQRKRDRDDGLAPANERGIPVKYRLWNTLGCCGTNSNNHKYTVPFEMTIGENLSMLEWKKLIAKRHEIAYDALVFDEKSTEERDVAAASEKKFVWNHCSCSLAKSHVVKFSLNFAIFVLFIVLSKPRFFE
ncbi:hypothetical protein RFI_03916 [Reticulomyxa filosa]|uniref:Uncharacterized protein n=1 Tax=Reticulomyxa filosa TaxID=46433 RepID=X6P4Q7_RETFI|nr:hypothetical protein RFI_03916 [Reticulomyxa filosa]|eukprot:ETO33191.1 hypothetical protein RFI_03916 [Reticulomyxa filosa]